MDEQHDQAVLQIEEIETDTEYDYLSILREMQQSLNADDELSASLKTTGGEANSILETDLDESLRLPTDLEMNENFAPPEDYDETLDYFADAKTLPLPEIPTDFINDLKAGSLETSAETNGSADDSLAALPEHSFDSEMVASEIPEMTSFEDNSVIAELDEQAFDDFAEMSPILFDKSEEAETAEPDFDAESLMMNKADSEEMAADSTATDLSAIPPEIAGENSTDMTERGDEMPTNLVFGEMFVEDASEYSTESLAKLTPPLIEIDEEAEIELTSLLEKFEAENPGVSLKLSESATATSEQNFDEQSLDEHEKLNEETLPVDFALNNGSMPLENDIPDFALPDAMLLEQDESDLAPEPSFALLDAEHQETAELESSELLAQMPDSDDLSLAIPSFIQAELSGAKQSPATDENLAVEAQAGEAQTDDYPVAALPIEFGENSAFDEAEEMPETALFESLVTAELPEISFEEDLPETLLISSLDDESERLLNDSLEEMPEIAFDDSETSPAITENGSQSFESSPAQAVFAASEQDLVSHHSKEISDSTKSVLFLKERFVIFKLDDTLYAFPAINVAEIGQLLPITPLPFVPSWFLGISNLRGDILSVVGLRELWEKNSTSPQKSKILIVRSEKQALTIGLVVDAVREMRHVKPEEIYADDSQNETESPFAPYKIGMVEYEGQNLCLLNAEKLLETLRS